MKDKILQLTISLLLLSAVLTACGGSYIAATSWPGLAANDEFAFLAYTTNIYAVDLTNGDEAWRYPSETDAKITFFADPILTLDGQLLAPSYDHNLYSLNPVTGRENWVFRESQDRLIASPLVTEEGIFQVSADGYVYALDLNGNFEWKFKTGGPIWASPTDNEECTCIFVASMDHHVYAINADSGEQIWKSDDLGGAIVGAPVFDTGGTVIVGTFGSEIVALDAENGSVKWRFATEGWVWSGGVLTPDGYFVGDQTGYIYSINVSTGEQIWRAQPGGAIIGSPLLVNDQLVFTTEENNVYFISSEGDVLDSQIVNGTLYASPHAAGDLILIAPMDADILLAALTPTGAQQWTFVAEK